MFRIQWLLLIVLISFFSFHSLQAQEKTTKKLNPIFVVTDLDGNKMEVKGMQLLIVRGSDQNLTTSFSVKDGESTLTLDLDELMGFENYWKTKEVKLFFIGGKVLKAKLPEGVVFHQVKGKALIGDEEVPYKLEVTKLLSAFRKGFKPIKSSK